MENLFGIFIVAICVTVVVATLPLANQQRAVADKTNRAMSIAQKQMEAIRNLGYSNLTPAQLLANGLIDSGVVQPNGMYRFHNVDGALFDAPSQVLPAGRGYVGITQIQIDVRRVTVRIEWNDSDRERNVVVSTYIANL